MTNAKESANKAREIIKTSGAMGFQEWRNSVGDYPIDLRGLQLHRVDRDLTEGLDLSDCRLDGRVFSNLHLKNINLERARLNGAALDDNSFQAPRMTSASFDQAVLSNQHFESAVAPGASFWGASLQNVTLAAANLEGADFEGAKLAVCRFHGANLRNTNWKRAELGTDKRAVSFENADLRGADFSMARGLEWCRAPNAVYDDATKFPPRFDPDSLDMVHVRDVASALPEQHPVRVSLGCVLPPGHVLDAPQGDRRR
jgi:uncharacterized protein YjbI with pentapeptide repeats